MNDSILKAYYAARSYGRNGEFAAAKQAKKEGWTDNQIITLIRELRKH